MFFLNRYFCSKQIQIIPKLIHKFFIKYSQGCRRLVTMTNTHKGVDDRLAWGREMDDIPPTVSPYSNSSSSISPSPSFTPPTPLSLSLSPSSVLSRSDRDRENKPEVSRWRDMFVIWGRRGKREGVGFSVSRPWPETEIHSKKMITCVLRLSQTLCHNNYTL